MLTRNDMHSYQNNMVQVIKEKSHLGLWAAMGLGKTCIALTAIADLFDDLDVHRVLVIAPLLPAKNTWPNELKLWQQSQHLSFKVLAGLSAATRLAALKDTSDIHIINRENIPWLVEKLGKKWPYDCVVIDEAHSFKNPSSKRFKALKKVNKFITRMIQLTGTPATNGLIGLWSQVYLLDRGERLGKTFGMFKQKYFISDYMGYSLDLRTGAEKEIYAEVKDICISMKAEDYLTLPDKLDNLIEIELPNKVRNQYDELEKEALLAIGDDIIVADQASALINKLLQCAAGAVYYEDRQYKVLHDVKLDALAEVIDGANGKPVLIAYNYISDKERIQQRFKTASTLSEPKVIDKWNRGEVPILLIHPASGGAGLNLQDGGSILCWFGPTWNLEHKLQTDARLHRQGQKETTVVHTIVVKGTAEELVVKALEDKNVTQELLLKALKNKIV